MLEQIIWLIYAGLKGQHKCFCLIKVRGKNLKKDASQFSKFEKSAFYCSTLYAFSIRNYHKILQKNKQTNKQTKNNNKNTTTKKSNKQTQNELMY